MRARVDAADGELGRATAHARDLAEQLAAAREEHRLAGVRVEEAATARRAAERERAARDRAAGRAAADLRSATAEAERADAARVRAEQGLEQAEVAVAELAGGSPPPRPNRSPTSPRPPSATGLRAEVAVVRTTETEARLGCARPRSGPARCTAARSRCAGRRGRSGPPASAPSRPAAPARGAAVVAEVRAGAQRALQLLEGRSPSRSPSATRWPPRAPGGRPSCSPSAPGCAS